MIYIEKVYYDLKNKHIHDEMFREDFNYYVEHYSDEIIGIYQKYLDFFKENSNPYILSVIKNFFDLSQEEKMIDYFLKNKHYHFYELEKTLHLSLNFEQTLFIHQVLCGEVFSYYKDKVHEIRKKEYWS